MNDLEQLMKPSTTSIFGDATIDHDIKHWISAEKDYWTQLRSDLQQRNYLTKSLASLIDTRLSYLEFAPTTKEIADEFWNEILLSPLPTHDAVDHPEEVLRMARTGNLEDFVAQRQRDISNQKRHIKLFQRRLELEMAPMRGEIVQQHHETGKKSHEMAVQFSQFLNSLNIAQKTATEARENDLVTAREELSKAVDSATMAILSAEPVKFWDSRRDLHHARAKAYKKALIIAAAVFLTIIVSLVIFEYSDGKTIEIFGRAWKIPTANFSLALTIIFTTAAIWLTRVIVKLMMTNLALEIEAVERSTMIKTYIALEKSNITKTAEIEMLFYSTLFRPSTNTLTDDSTSPEYIRLIEALIQKKSG